MNINAHLDALEHEERRAWLVRLEADLHVIATKVASLAWAPGGVVLVRDEVERQEYLEALQQALSSLAEARGVSPRGNLSPSLSGIRLQPGGTKTSMNRQDYDALLVDHDAIRRTLVYVRRSYADDARMRALALHIQKVLQRGSTLLARLRDRTPPLALEGVAS